MFYIPIFEVIVSRKGEGFLSRIFLLPSISIELAPSHSQPFVGQFSIWEVVTNNSRNPQVPKLFVRPHILMRTWRNLRVIQNSYTNRAG